MIEDVSAIVCHELCLLPLKRAECRQQGCDRSDGGRERKIEKWGGERGDRRGEMGPGVLEVKSVCRAIFKNYHEISTDVWVLYVSLC